MRLNPYLNFDGTCEEAFNFYAQLLGGKIEALHTFGDTPAAEHVPDDHRHKIMHARLAIGDQAIMGSDCIPARPYPGVSGCYVSLNVDKVADAERIYAALAEGGQIQMPLEKTFWAERFGMLVDRFGVPWMLNCEAAAK